MASKLPGEIPTFVSEALEVNDTLSSDVALLEDLLVGVATTSGISTPSPSAKTRLVSVASAGAMRYAPFFSKLCELFDLSRDAVLRLCERSLDERQWVEGPHPSVGLMHVGGGERVAGADVGLVRMPSAFPWPNHRHFGEERALLLEGSYVDDQGKLYRPGDFHEMPADSQHSFFVRSPNRLVLAVVLFGGFEILAE